MINIDTKTELIVSVKSKNNVLFSGYAHTVTSKNDRGVFDVLPLHTNFITLINDYIIIDKGLPTEKNFELERGVLYILSNKVDVYVGI